MSDIGKDIDRFKEFVDFWKHGYRFAVFSYVAFNRQNELPMLIAGSIRLLPVLDASKIKFFTHNSKSITAANTHWKIENEPLGFLAHIADGLIALPNGKKISLCNDDKNVWAQFNPGMELIKNNQPRIVNLKLSGCEIDTFLENERVLDELDSELQSSVIPFNGLGDLCGALNVDYQLANPNGQKSELLITAEHLLALDRSRSTIAGGNVRINLLMAAGLIQDQLRIGIRVWDGSYEGRKSISGDEIAWSEQDGIARGSGEISVSETHAVLVFLSHSNKLFDRWWLFDPVKHINHRFAAYMAIDNDFTELKKFLSGQSRKPANDLEIGVALLLGLFGFTAFHHGLIPTLQEAPDLLAFTEFTEASQLAVIECTIGIPNENNKISKLIARIGRIRESLLNSGNAHVEVLPIIVTISPRASVPKDIEEAGKHGVVVITREDIDSIIERIKLPPPSPSQLFAKAKTLLPFTVSRP